VALLVFFVFSLPIPLDFFSENFFRKFFQKIFSENFFRKFFQKIFSENFFRKFSLDLEKFWGRVKNSLGGGWPHPFSHGPAADACPSLEPSGSGARGNGKGHRRVVYELAQTGKQVVPSTDRPASHAELAESFGTGQQPALVCGAGQAAASASPTVRLRRVLEEPPRPSKISLHRR
jgi:hypothetical protein